MRKQLTRRLFAVMLAGMVSFTPVSSVVHNPHITTVSAHSGRTDSNGGHRDNRNASGLGNYHYHCGGYPPHLHENGVCPYTDAGSSTSVSSTAGSTGSSSGSSSVSKSTIKKVQKKLNALGYGCGTPDGVMGSKTKRALKKFQNDNDLKADGIIGKKTLSALGLS